jgi:CDP-glycerol glycerophosphotransferase (TagB/SpsB family)
MSTKQKGKAKISPLLASLDGNILHLEYQRARKVSADTQDIDISLAPENRNQVTRVTLKSMRLKDKVHLVQKVSGNETLVVFSENGLVKYYRHTDGRTHPLTRLLVVKSKTYIHVTKRGIRLAYICFIENKYGIPVRETYLAIGNEYRKRKEFPVYKAFPSKKKLLQKSLFTDFIPMAQLLQGEVAINARIGVSIDVDGTVSVNLFLINGSRRLEAKGKKWFYAPVARTHRDGISISVRRNSQAGLNLVRRPLENIEKTFTFRLYESLPVSFFMYHGAHFVRRLSKQKVNLYFEKVASQAEEGAIDILRIARASGGSKNYFIINKAAKAYQTIKNEAGVVPNFTLKSYWLMYRANNIIATEVPQHMNILRSDNKYARRAPYSQKFVFLQHGVTYLKAQDKNSAFIAGREGEPDYMVVGSMKERDVTADMLNIPEERLLNTGLPIFDNITYGHINQKSPDIVTIMLTWKPYEEHLRDFTKSTYYQTVIEVYELTKSLIENEKIRIVAHPKFKKLLAGTDLAEALWDGPVSQVLGQTKLLVTDYSSVCYNVFYQGGGVIFYQPDLNIYEQNNGKLIPADDEYIGPRLFNREDLREVLGRSIVKGGVNLSTVRTAEYNQRYAAINEHHDGKNCERICERLRELGIL